MITKDWTYETMPIGYRNSLRQEIFKIKNQKVELKKEISYKQFANSDGVKRSTDSIMEETISSFGTGILSGRNTLVQLCRLTQQVNQREAQINKSVADGFIETGSSRGAKKSLQRELLKKSLDGKYITINDRNGNKRQYTVESYSDLVARTKLQEASAQAVIDTAFEIGEDLVQISSHNTKSAVCAVFEGKIYSVSGNNKHFPAMSEAPPFHPNCLHTMSIVFPAALKSNGTYDKYSEFSKGETDKHPTRTKFIPVNERELK